MSDTALTVVPQSQVAVVEPPPGELTIDELIRQAAKIQQAMRAVMKVDEHYGIIPGTGKKPSLLKPGAEKLCLLFRLDPEYEMLTKTEEPALIVYTVRCTLTHIPTGTRVASGLGACSSRESKYGLRSASRRCPKCGKEAIIKGHADFGGGFVCWKKKDGCGAKFSDDDRAISDQPEGKVPVDNVWDQQNTILKMAAKRALVAAVLNGTAASDIFTQDLEDLAAQVTPEPPHSPPPAQPEPAPPIDVTPEPAVDRIPDTTVRAIYGMARAMKWKMAALLSCAREVLEAPGIKRIEDLTAHQGELLAAELETRQSQEASQ